MIKAGGGENDGPVADENLTEQISQRDVHVELEISKGKGLTKVTSVYCFVYLGFLPRRTIGGTRVICGSRLGRRE